MQRRTRQIITMSLLFQVMTIFTENTSSLVPFVTVYVHGTMSSTGIKALHKLWPNFSFGASGLHHLDKLPEHAFLRADALRLQQGAPDRFCCEHFYTFGWSGRLSFADRKQAGLDLYLGLKTLLGDYKKNYGFYPKLRIMTFSHGGNVALNMVQHLPFLVDEHVYLELLIIACPVQKVTEKLIEHDEIDHVYTIASNRDLLQVADFYTYEKKRCFPVRFFDTTRKNCLQIKVSVNGRGLGHYDLFRSFVPHIPLTLSAADSWVVSQLEGPVDHNCGVLEYDVQDEGFQFFNGINLISVVSGNRKK